MPLIIIYVSIRDMTGAVILFAAYMIILHSSNQKTIDSFVNDFVVSKDTLNTIQAELTKINDFIKTTASAQGVSVPGLDASTEPSTIKKPPPTLSERIAAAVATSKTSSAPPPCTPYTMGVKLCSHDGIIHHPSVPPSGKPGVIEKCGPSTLGVKTCWTTPPGTTDKKYYDKNMKEIAAPQK